MKLMLGTVQFGITYGAFNATGQVPLDMVEMMLSAATDAGIDMIDTARVYGDSEAILARAGAPNHFGIVSKCPDLCAETDPVAALHAAFDASCAALGVMRMYGYLLHNADDLARPGVWKALKGLRNAGKVYRIGISGYDPDIVTEFCNKFPLTLVQLPANVLEPWYERISFPEAVEVHVRSAFLQGFLLSDPAKLPQHLVPFRPVLEQFRTEARAQGFSPLQAALAPLLASSNVTRVVVGADQPKQLREILLAARSLAHRPVPTLGPFHGATRTLTDPRRWLARL